MRQASAYRIPLFKVHMPTSVGPRLLDTLYSGTVTEGPKSLDFERKFGVWIGNDRTAVVNSGTSALTIALRLAGVGPSTEVVSTPLTCVATNSAVLSLGATIKWADIDVRNGCIDPDSVAEAVSDRTRAILFVDWAGCPANLDALNTIAASCGASTVEDAAHSLGASYRGERIGRHCDFVCFSFQAIKPLTTIDGGAVACRDQAAVERAKRLRWYGLDRSAPKTPTHWAGDLTESGYKMHLNDVLATIGLEQLDHLDSTIECHKRNAQFLIQRLREQEHVTAPLPSEGSDPSFWVLSLRFDSPERRTSVSDALERAGVQSSILHQRNDLYAVFESQRVHLPNLDYLAERILCVPCGWWLSDDALDDIATTIERALSDPTAVL